MTTTMRPFSWTVKLVLNSFKQVIKLTHDAPFAPKSDTSSSAVSDVPFIEHAKGSAKQPMPEPTIDAGYPLTMDLNGIEYQFIECADTDSIVVKRQVYQPKLTDHPLYGRKLLPANGLKWEQVAAYNVETVEDAVKQFIVEELKQGVATAPKAKAPEKAIPLKEVTVPEAVTVIKQPEVPVVTKLANQSKPVTGTLLAMGERSFADSKRPGKTYTNYAIALKTGYGEKVLQGEGLADALAEADAKIGDEINVIRRGQIDVQLVNKVSGEAVIDERGQPMMGKKWLWAITVN